MYWSIEEKEEEEEEEDVPPIDLPELSHFRSLNSMLAFKCISSFVHRAELQSQRRFRQFEWSSSGVIFTSPAAKSKLLRTACIKTHFNLT